MKTLLDMIRQAVRGAGKVHGFGLHIEEQIMSYELIKIRMKREV